MKKKIICIASASILLLIVGICATILVPKFISETPGEQVEQYEEGLADTGNAKSSGEIEYIEFNKGEDFFYITTVEEIKPLAEKYGFEVKEPEYEGGAIFIHEAECLGMPVQYIFTPSEDIVLEEMTCFYIPCRDDYQVGENITSTYTGSELKGEIEEFLYMIEQVFQVSIEHSFCIVSIEGEMLSKETISSYDEIMLGKARLEFSLRDRNGFYWSLTSETTEEGLLFLSFTNYYNQYADNITDITVK